jgi:preprotein translocase SecE subunit
MADTTKEEKKGMRVFFAEVKDEGKRVTWPTRDKAKQSVIVVLAVTAIIAAYIAVVDLFLSQIYRILMAA